MVDRFLLELVEQRLRVAEPVLDQLGELPVGLLATGRRQALPEEAVVPQLRAVVEQLVDAGLPGSSDDLDQRCSAEALITFDQLVGLVDIGLVVLAPVIVERLGRHDRRERVLGVGQIWKLEGHGRTTPVPRGK
jgi:hypothetical protein